MNPRLSLMVMLLIASNARAADYPGKPIRLIVPFAPGGPADIVGRAVSQGLVERLKQQIVIDNRGGGGGNIGAELAARSAADGYTLLIATPGILIANPAMGKTPFDTQRDFAPVVNLSNMTSIMVLHPSIPAKTLTSFIEFARARPGQLTYGSSGNGSASHLGTELFKQMTKLDIAHVPYKGAAPAVMDILGGHLTMLMIGVPVSLPHVRAGKVNALGIASLKRSPVAPDIPTLSEAGLPGFEVANWLAIMAPAGAPPTVIARLNSEINASLTSADTRQRLLQQGLEYAPNTSAEFSAYLKSETEKWTRVVRTAKIRPG
jgi:tripartite-type tricarboxylate transporter receptor subunit TctC